MTPINPKKILITWWGALERGGETAGDLMAVIGVSKEIEKTDLSYEIASIYPYEGLKAIVNWREINALDYSVLVFVCGPLIADSEPFQELIKKFSHCKTIAVGVSILPKTSLSYFNKFDYILARDGIEETYFDVALAQAPNTQNTIKQFRHREGERPLSIGLCFRGLQREYMEENCLSNKVEDIVLSYIKSRAYHFKFIDTKLNDSCRNPYEIYNYFSNIDIIVTTRLHGSLFCIGNRTPFIAIDQVKGGAKLSYQLNKLKYPLIIKAEELDYEKIDNLFIVAINDNIIADTLSNARKMAIFYVENTLNIFIKTLYEAINE